MRELTYRGKLVVTPAPAEFFYTTTEQFVDPQPLDNATVPPTIWVWYTNSRSRSFLLNDQIVGEYQPVALWSGTLPDGSHTFSDGVSEISFVVDAVVQSIGAGTLSIQDDEYTVEAGQLLAITLERTSPAQGAVSVDYATTGLSANFSGTATWGDGLSNDFGLLYSAPTVATETGTLTLSNPQKTSDRLGQPTLGLSTATITITNAAQVQDNYFFSLAGSSSGAGTEADPLDIDSFPPAGLKAGDTCHFNGGDTFSRDLTNTVDGSVSARITFTSYGGGQAVIRSFTNEGDYVTFSNLIFDGEKTAVRPLRVQNCDHVIYDGVTCRNALRNGLEITNVPNITVRNYTANKLLRGTFTTDGAQVEDAHGISVSDGVNLTISGTSDISQVSGDALQVDPDRLAICTVNVTEGPHTWYTAPLTEDFNAGWLTGNTPGENAIDTKVATGQRMTLNVENLTCYGWQNGIPNMAALNIKEGVDAVFNRCTFYNNEIALRFRGPDPDITIKNSLLYDNNRALRVEDGLANLKVYHNTFGDGNTTVVEEAGAGFGVGTDAQANVFYTSVPSQFSAVTNQSFADADVVSVTTNDYRPFDTATWINSAPTVTSVTVDITGQPRDASRNYGAYEAVVATGSTGVHDYYEYLQTTPTGGVLEWSYDMRSAAELDQIVDNQSASPRPVYDPGEDATWWENVNTSIAGNEQIELPNGRDGPAMGLTSGQHLFYAEMKWSANVGTQKGSFSASFDQKFVHLKGLENANSNRGFEMRMNYNSTPTGSETDRVGEWDLRGYGITWTASGDDILDGSALDNRFWPIAGEWVYCWFYADLDNNRITMWYGDETQTPVRMINDQPYSVGGTSSNIIDKFWWQINTSSSSNGVTFQVYGRELFAHQRLDAGSDAGVSRSESEL